MGVELPLPGSFTFQRMFFDSLHCVGGSASAAAAPVFVGPRHWGQFASARAATTYATNASVQVNIPVRIAITFSLWMSGWQEHNGFSDVVRAVTPPMPVQAGARDSRCWAKSGSHRSTEGTEVRSGWNASWIVKRI